MEVFWTQDLKLISSSNSGLPPFASISYVVKFMDLNGKSAECFTAALFIYLRGMILSTLFRVSLIFSMTLGYISWKPPRRNLLFCKLSNRYPVDTSEWKFQRNKEGGTLGSRVDDIALRNTDPILEHRQKHEISMGYCNFAIYEAKFVRMVSVTFREGSHLFSRIV